MVKQTSYIPGLILILIGLLILTRNLGMYFLSFKDVITLGFVSIGALLLFQGIVRRNKTGIYPGTLLLLVGTWLTMERFRITNYYTMDMMWPLFIVIPGISFFITYIFKPSEWQLLIPGSILTIIGGGFLLAEMEYIRFWQIGTWLGKFWPLLIIVIGIFILLNGLKKR